jgi:2'-5' RNA ligase
LCRIVYRTAGCFPNRRNPRVFWVGIEDDSGELLRLQKRIDAVMVRFGVEPESRPFHPHVTLGRATGGKNMERLLTIMETITFVSRPVLLSEIAVVRSTLKPSGSVYATLQTFPLIGKTGPSEYIL